MAKNIDPYLLIVTMEECGELVQACSKVYRHGNKKEDRKLLSEEVGDVLAMMNLLCDAGLVDLDVVDEKVAEQIAAIEERLGGKLDAQHGILVALIDRIRSLDNEIIRQDTLIKTILGVPQLIDSNKIAKADRDDQRKD